MTPNMFIEEAYLWSNGEMTPDFIPNDTDRNPLDVVLFPSFIYASKKLYQTETEQAEFINERIDAEFCQMFLRIKPVYRASEFIDYHYNKYNGDKSTFLKHLKFVILPLMKKIIEKDPDENDLEKKDYPDFTDVSEIILAWIMEKEKILNSKEEIKSNYRFETKIKKAKNVIVNNESMIEKIEHNFFKTKKGRAISIIGLIISILMLTIAILSNWENIF